MPQVPGPEALLSQAQIARKHLDRMPPGAGREHLSFERAIESAGKVRLHPAPKVALTEGTGCLLVVVGESRAASQ